MTTSRIVSRKPARRIRAPANVTLTIRRCALWRAAALWVWIAVGSVLCATPGYCQDRVSVEMGKGNNVDVVGVGVGSTDWERWSVGKDWSLSLYGLGRIDYWQRLSYCILVC